MWYSSNLIARKITSAVLCLFAACTFAEEAQQEVSIRWRSHVSLNDCPVVLPLDSFPCFTAGQRCSLCVFLNGEELPSQLDDLNGDSVPDEIAFLLSLRKNKSYTLQLRTLEKPPSYASEVWAEMYLNGAIGGEFREHTAEGKTYGIKPVRQQTFYPSDKSFRLMHHHGVAFESALMAYRVYFDSRQTVDVYAKRKPQLELQQSLWYPCDSLLAVGYGDDVLKVGNTIGVGSVRPCQNGKLCKIEPFRSRTQRIIASGPVRTIVETEVNGWQPVPSLDDTLSMRVRYTLFARHRDVFCEVFLSAPVLSLVTGVQRVGKGEYKCFDHCVASWGTDWPVNDTVKFARETVGLAVCVPGEYDVGSLPDTQNVLVQLRPSTYLNFFLTVVSLKENDPPVTCSRQFWHFVDSWQKTLRTELDVSKQLIRYRYSVSLP